MAWYLDTDHVKLVKQRFSLVSVAPASVEAPWCRYKLKTSTCICKIIKPIRIGMEHQHVVSSHHEYSLLVANLNTLGVITGFKEILIFESLDRKISSNGVFSFYGLLVAYHALSGRPISWTFASETWTTVLQWFNYEILIRRLEDNFSSRISFLFFPAFSSVSRYQIDAKWGNIRDKVLTIKIIDDEGRCISSA